MAIADGGMVQGVDEALGGREWKQDRESTNNALQKGTAWDHNPSGKLEGTNQGLKFFQSSKFLTKPLMQGLFGSG